MFPCLFDVATVGLTTEHTAYLRSISRCRVVSKVIYAPINVKTDEPDADGGNIASSIEIKFP